MSRRDQKYIARLSQRSNLDIAYDERQNEIRQIVSMVEAGGPSVPYKRYRV